MQARASTCGGPVGRRRLLVLPLLVLPLASVGAAQVRSEPRRPFVVAITSRQDQFGFLRDVYFGYVLDRRGHVFVFAASIGSDQLGGVPTDLAFDDLRNLGALPNRANRLSAGFPAAMNGKGLVRFVPSQGFLNTNEPTYLFAAVRGAHQGAETIAVIDLATGLRVDANAFHPGVQSVPAPGAVRVMDYFRQ